jgi:hypothetical protein
MMDESDDFRDAVVAVTEEAPQTVESILRRVAELRAKQAELVAAEKKLANEIKGLEELAIEQLQTLGLRGCRTSDRTWYLSEYISISVPKENRDRVLAVAETVVDADGNNMADEIRTVTTQTLRAWLMEQRRNAEGVDENAPIAKGTAFDGLVSEFRRMRLGSSKRG